MVRADEHIQSGEELPSWFMHRSMLIVKYESDMWNVVDVDVVVDAQT